jgi:hypothetical protein
LHLRSMIIISPMLIAISGIGIWHVTDTITQIIGRKKISMITIPVLCCGIILSSWTIPLKAAIFPPKHNKEYSKNEIEQVVRIIQEYRLEKESTPVVIDQRRYVAYYSKSKSVNMPFADYDALVKYFELNDTDFLYVNFRLVEEYPFFERFKSEGENGEFKLVYQGTDAYNGLVKLYSVNRLEESD